MIASAVALSPVMANKRYAAASPRGFSLVEMAVVLVVLGFLLTAFLLPLQAQREQNARSQTENTLVLAQKILLGFAQSKGRLPCPATSASNGIEKLVSAGVCSAQAGYLPAATLGFQPVDASGFALDGWNNRIHYAVTQYNITGGAIPYFTTANGMNTIGMAALKPDLRVCTDAANCSGSVYLVQDAVAVLFSTGRNFAQSAGSDEIANLAATTTFYSRTPTASTAAVGEFDDIVLWISQFAVYNAMIQAGQLH